MTSRHMARRAKIFSPLVLSQISQLVAQGLGAAEIAERIGCSLGTLRVKCSHHGISLRRCDGTRAESERKLHARIIIHLARAAAIRLQHKAQSQGTTGPRLAAALLEAVVQDNLYDAVIDGEVAQKADRNDAAAASSNAELPAGFRKKLSAFNR